MSIDYDAGLVEQIGSNLDLREPNQGALRALARRLHDATPGTEMIADLATGVGKTYIAGGLLDYLYESGIRNVLIVTPGSTIQRKTIDNLTPGHPKYLRGLQSRPMVITLDTVERGEVGAALQNPDAFKVFVFTVQSLLRPRKEDRRRADKPHETLGTAVREYLEQADDLVVIADEHHVYYSGSAKKFEAAITELAPLATIGLTATPHEKSLPMCVYQYPLSAAIADGYVKIPVLVTREDGIHDVRTQLADGLTLLDAKREAMRAYCQQVKGRPFVEPVMFLVASTIEEATEYRDLLAGSDMLGEPDQVLLVTSEEPDATLARLDQLEDPASRIRAVVSVSMLKEGWDVKNIYVIASVRSMESDLLTEQILGRGLRLPFGQRTGNPMLDTVEVLSHRSFATLLKQARSLLEETLGDRVEQAAAVSGPAYGRRQDGSRLSEQGEITLDFADARNQAVDILLPGPAATDPDQGTLFGDEDLQPDANQSHVGLSLATMDARVAAADASRSVLTRRLEPRSPGGVKIPLFLPSVVTRWERDPFSLAQVNLDSVEALGRQFADDNAPTLTRKAIDAERGQDGSAHIVIRDQLEHVAATQTVMPFETIEQDLVSRLLRQNAVAARASEINAAGHVAQAFMKGADVTQDTPWRAEHGRLATARLTEWIAAKQTSSPRREVREVRPVRWPDPTDRYETRPPADRHVVTSSKDFARGYPYSGWDKSVYEINGFDAFSTEFVLATIFEKSPGVRAWVRIDETVPLRITYLMGAVQRVYEPDFIVIDDSGVHWVVEGKRDSEMTSPVVQAKRDAAAEWVQTVNASDEVHETWAYVLASESVCAAATTWSGVTSGGQVTR
ncbi:DEAD/DEAH box helicase family protein [Luteipulveratus sp. YIM 133132]|uniref:DEAD/DEAH box helicase family protein n=1 Tax=Luteipulveratus flavus TaxID=3031728 RepID=UPI0023B1348E|nr:DEAD/DEAH box helicase family protein [Luteipulveratus sp. YIM 133132]MDE9364698.1 DEAD/DEAH box helicase family protein [Luteipulveratus sp. YIM 133132]